MNPAFSSASLPEYHPGLLLVRMRSVDRSPAPGVAGGVPYFGGGLGPDLASLSAVSATPPTPGFAALSFFERAGMVKSVIPVARTATTTTAARATLATATVPEARYAVSSLLALRPQRAEERSVVGASSLIEIERDADAGQLRLALASDPHVAAVSRVPVRYLAAQARAAKTERRTRGQAGADAARAGRGGVAAVPPAELVMWNLRRIRWAQARALPAFRDADQIRVAVLDTGVDRNHPDLAGRVVGYEFEHPNVPGASGSRDIHGHGTHVSGIIAALTDNAVGVKGVCACQLLVWKIFDDEPEFTGPSFDYLVDPVMYLRALDDCVQRDVDVVNLSIGGSGEPSEDERELFARLVGNGTVVVAAMGNEREDGSPTSFPAAVPGVIAVGATSLDDRVTNFSNRGNHIAIAAPGQAIWSTLPTSPGQTGFRAETGPGGRPRQGKPLRREVDYDAWPGTSMAAPHVSGALALLLAQRGRLSQNEVRDALAQSADKVAGMGGRDWHPDYGAGRLNLEALLR